MSTLVNEKINAKSVSYDLIDNNGRMVYRIILRESSKSFGFVTDANIMYQNDGVGKGDMCQFTELIIENAETKRRSTKRCYQSFNEIKSDIIADFDTMRRKFNWV